MDRAVSSKHSAAEGISIRNGPITGDKMDLDEPATNGNAKRKSRASITKAVNYNDGGSESEDAVPLVCPPLGPARL